MKKKRISRGLYELKYKSGSGYLITYSERGNQKTKILPVGTTLKTAKTIHAQIFSDLALKKLGLHEQTSESQKLQKITLIEFYDLVIELRQSQNASPATIRTNKFHINQLIKFFGQHTLILHITPTEISRYKKHIAARISARGVNKYLKELRKIFNFAMKSSQVKFIAENPIQPNHFVKANKMLLEIYTRDEINQILYYLAEPFIAFKLLFFLSKYHIKIDFDKITWNDFSIINNKICGHRIDREFKKILIAFRYKHRTEKIIQYHTAQDIKQTWGHVIANLDIYKKNFFRCVVNHIENNRYRKFTQAELDRISYQLYLPVLAFQIILFTAGRRGEVCPETSAGTGGLRWNDIDFQNDTIRLSGKTKSERAIFLHPILKKILQWARPERYILDGLVIPKISDWITKQFNHAKKALNIKKRGSVHIIRHSTASYLLEAGNDIRIVQEILGHKDISTTTIYTHILKRHQKSAFQKLKF